MFYRVQIRDNETGEVLADTLAESTAHALAEYVRITELDPGATADSVSAAAGLDTCECGNAAAHLTTTIGYTRRDPITNVAEVDVFATVHQYPAIPDHERSNPS